MYTAIYIKIFSKKMNWKNRNILMLIIYSLSIWAILNCKSRGSLLTLLVFIIWDSFIPKRWLKNKNTIITITIIIILIGLLIPYIYTRLYIQGFDYTLPFINKSLYTGREHIWSNFYYSIRLSKKNLIFGLGSKSNLWVGNSLNMHNNYLAVIANFGILGFIMYYGFWIKQIGNIYRKKNISDYQVSLVICFICILINGYIEVSTLWMNMFFFNFISLGFASHSEKQISGEVTLN